MASRSASGVTMKNDTPSPCGTTALSTSKMPPATTIPAAGSQTGHSGPTDGFMTITSTTPIASAVTAVTTHAEVSSAEIPPPTISTAPSIAATAQPATTPSAIVPAQRATTAARRATSEPQMAGSYQVRYRYQPWVESYQSLRALGAPSQVTRTRNALPALST